MHMTDPPRFNLFRLVLRNLRNRPYRNLVLVMVFALIAASLFSAQYLAGGASECLDRGTGWLGADLIVVPADSTAAGEASLLTGRPSMFFFNSTGVGVINRIPGIARASPQILITSLSGQSCCSGYVQLIAIDPEKDFSLTRWMDTEYGMPLETDGIIVGSMVEGDTGSELRFYGHTFHVNSRLVPTGMRGIDSAVFMTMKDAAVMAAESAQNAEEPLMLPEGKVSWVLVQLGPGVSSADTAEAIRQQIPGTRVITPADLSGTVTGHLAGIMLILHYTAIAVTAIAVPALLIASVIFAREVNEEVSLLGMLGATRAFILRLVLAESFAASVIGTLAGIGAGAVALVSFQDFIAYSLEIPFSPPSFTALLTGAGWTLLLTIMLGGLLSIYPTIRILRSESYRKIRS